MRRIYFLVLNVEITHKIVDELRSEGIKDLPCLCISQKRHPS
jgi:hypothetical protein